ncbi:TIGR00341 family protein [Halococcus agarilyticus]|uniref:TIGR00341 family protein n=1 Tax=Halococcus agarilyticus TaxID=1232219 RepID=UPI000677BF61|nr:TIGR00341 family protein [Halococcus agarilyticus]
MRLIQVLVPEGTREAILGELDEEGIDYAVWEETGRGEFEAVVSFPVPTSGVEPVLDRLRAAGVEEDAYTIVQSTETVVSRRIGALRERYTDLRISRDELVARAADLAPATSTYVAFLVLSTVIAATGLLLDSAATIIGAMVIAPLMGPAISASVGTVVDESDLARRGIALQVGGLLLAIVCAAVLGVILKETVLVPPGLDITEVPQIAERTQPNFLSLFLALGSGIAASISIVRGAGSTLIGVAIAVALVPPAATAGLGIAWGAPLVFVTASTLVLVNLLAINLSALIVLWLSGYRPAHSSRVEGARSALVGRSVRLIGALVVLSIVLAAVTFASFQVATFEQQTNAEVDALLDGPDYEGATLVDTTVDYDGVDLALGNPAEVRVTVGLDSADVPPDLASRIDGRLTQATGRSVNVQVVFTLSQQSG